MRARRVAAAAQNVAAVLRHSDAAASWDKYEVRADVTRRIPPPAPPLPAPPCPGAPNKNSPPRA